MSLVFYTVNGERQRLSSYAIKKLNVWAKKGKGRYFASAGRNDVSRFRGMVYDPIDRYNIAKETKKSVSTSKLPHALVLSLQQGKKVLCEHKYKVYIHSD